MRALLSIALLFVGCARAVPVSADAPPADIDAAIDAPAIDASTCPTAPCDLHLQCGCSAVQTCDIDFNDLMGNACRGITAMGREPDTCDNVAACDRGYVCVGSGTNSSCQRYCETDADCDGPRGQCAIQLVGTNSTPIAGAVTCSSSCDPVAATHPACPATWTCDVFTVTYMGASKPVTDCRKAGTAGQGAACSATVACASGFTCVNTGSASVCAKLCPRPANTGCPVNTTCGGFTTPLVIAAQEYGACL